MSLVWAGITEKLLVGFRVSSLRAARNRFCGGSYSAMPGQSPKAYTWRLNEVEEPS